LNVVGGTRSKKLRGGLLLAMGVVVYVVLLLAQERAAEEVCAAHPPGTQVTDARNLPKSLLLSPRGPLTDPRRPSVERVIYCAALTMCDTSCSLEIENGVVIQARLGKL
jgi:hypothetical protein